ncbi:MAG TPA: M20/M25/M40 family metallo-hydrolase [Bacteroidales bacterium]|nr:M20/M25/M40 family metallo-hydrolase [Bacteroidales bacterium]
MRFAYKILFVFLMLASANLNGQEKPEEKGLRTINEDVIKAQMSFLASDWMEGRAAGEKGERMAGDYIAGMLQLYGVKPYGDYIRTRSNPGIQNRTYFQNFVLLKTMPGNEQVMQIRSFEGKTIKITSLTKDVDYTIRTADPAFELTAPVVFAGYAYKNDNLHYNDFAKLDIKGKVVLRISGFPKFVTDKLNRSVLNYESAKMDSVIRAMGAAGIIEFSPDDRVVGRPERRDFMNMSPSEGNQWQGRPRVFYSIPGERNNDAPKRANVSIKTANEILKGSGIDIEEYIAKADINQPYLLSPLNNKEIYIKTSVITSQVAVRNIIGIIEGKKTDEVIVLGAHYDHIGSGNGYIWNGADDNASGTVGIMTLAKAIMETGTRPEKTIIIALWTSEELGLLGSRYYLDNLDFPINNLKLNLNFDMISRYVTDSEPTKVTMTYTKKYKIFEDITVANQHNYEIILSIDYQPSDDPPGGSDHRSFVAKGIPVMRFKPGHREEYHRPGDEIKTLNWDIMEKIIRISFLNIWQLANSEW